jgi:hypothetical protein
MSRVYTVNNPPVTVESLVDMGHENCALCEEARRLKENPLPGTLTIEELPVGTEKEKSSQPKPGA